MRSADPDELARLLLGGRLLPLTSSLLLVEGTATELARLFADVRGGTLAAIGGGVTYDPVTAATLEDALRHLEPLSGPDATRFLLLPTHGTSPGGRPWTLFLDNRFRGMDAGSVVALFASRGHRTLTLSAQPHTYDPADDTGYHGVRKLGVGWSTPEPPGFAGRSVSLRRAEGERWEFVAAGEPQPFEQPETYRARRIRDRLPLDLMATYAAALGARPWEEDFYDLDAAAVLLRHTHTPEAHWFELSLADAQASRATGRPVEEWARHPGGAPAAAQPPSTRLSWHERLRGGR